MTALHLTPDYWPIITSCWGYLRHYLCHMRQINASVSVHFPVSVVNISAGLIKSSRAVLHCQHTQCHTLVGLFRGPTDIKMPKLSLTKSGIWEVDPWQIAPSFSWRHCYPQRHCKENRPIILPPREVTNASSRRRWITELKSRKWCTEFHTGNPGSHAGIGWRLLDVGSHISTKNVLAFNVRL